MWSVPQKIENVNAFLKHEDIEKQMDNVCLDGKLYLF